MGRVIVYLLLIASGTASLVFPWVGVISAYVVAVMAPQDIWWWDFGGQRPSFDVMLPVLIGCSFAILAGKVRIRDLETRINFLVLLLWLSFTIAYLFGPYVDVVNRYRFFDAEVVYVTISKAFLTYFVGAALLNTLGKLKVASLVIVVTAVYMTYWANAQYFVYHIYGRIGGPVTPSGAGIYHDQNEFAVLFVVGAPFVFFLAQGVNSKIIKWASWIVVLFSWHAIFLTASRGALLGVAAELLVFAARAKKRTVAVVVLSLFSAAYVFEAGSVMKGRADTISHYSQNASAEDRLDAWMAAIKMMEAHPFSGVGFASFGQAYPTFSTSHPHIAHNTFFQIGGECGVLGGILYLLLMSTCLRRLHGNGIVLRAMPDGRERRFYLMLNEACIVSIVGFFVCSMFLSLETYELMYYLLLITNCNLLQSAELDRKREACETAVRSRYSGAITTNSSNVT